jgi:oxygen-independent coproporphyrinogen III oxidase
MSNVPPPKGPQSGSHRPGSPDLGRALPGSADHLTADAFPSPMRLVAEQPAPEVVSSVYVHVPFCAKRCHYCDFSVTVARKVDLEGWLAALAGELNLLAEEERFPLAPSLATLFVGGGTPSLMGPEAMGRLAGVLGRDLLRDVHLEWTAEANPESFTEEVAGGWSRAGVNRVSLGAQSFHREALRWMGRIHGPAEIDGAVVRARNAGIRNISLDLIFGLPASVGRDWASDLDHALALGVPHLSLYGLTAEGGTPLGQVVREGRVTLASEEAYREEFLEASRRLVAGGYRHYEVSNFALPGFEARHNLVYWTLGAYLGLGSSAHSFMHPYRRWNLKDWGAYQRIISAGRPPWESEERLSAREGLLERIWLGLRTDAGIRLDHLGASARDLVGEWALQGNATVGEDAVALTPEGWLLLDHLAVSLVSAWERDASGGGPLPASPGAGPSSLRRMG